MSDNEHSTYFSQTIATQGTEDSAQIDTGSGEQGSIGVPTQANPVRTAGRHRHDRPNDDQSQRGPLSLARGQSPESDMDEFRTSLVSKMDSLVQDFRTEKITRMEALYQVLQVLHDANIDEPDRRATLEEYTLYIDLIAAQQKGAEERGVEARAGQTLEEPRERHVDDSGQRNRNEGGDSHAGEAERLLRELRKELLRKKRRRSPSISSNSDNDSERGTGEGESNRKKRVYQSQLPWYAAEVATEARELDENRKKTRETLAVFQKDLNFAEREIRRAASAPQGFPESEWKRIFKGEALNLDVIFSNLHHIAPPKENVGRIGRTEISLGKADPARKVQTSGDWTVAWHAATKATTFAFPHRSEELRKWGDYMASEFSAKQLSAHHKLIAFDKAVRAMVGGGQAILLTDRDQFTFLYSAYLLPDGVQGSTPASGRYTVGDHNPRDHSSETCRRFNSAGGCRSTAGNCRYRHICLKCKQRGHGQESCPQQN
jgi:hypothetical protein